ncbi:MAG: M23 family metallopeptidase [Caulobacterales bacterium]|nr:M23 family metallopeptidase [Caulobacterales bacterium]
MKVLALAAVAPLALLLTTAAAPADAPPKLALPVACTPGKTCEIQHYVDRDPGPGTRDYRCGLETYQGHDGVDIRVPDLAAQRRGVAVLAAAPGKVLRVRDEMPDISITAPGAPPVPNDRMCGNGMVIDHGGGWMTQYCHLARGSVSVKAGDAVAAGTPIGRVGMSGGAEFPHLHFKVIHGTQVVDPFAPDMSHPESCAAQAGLWTTKAAAAMPYHAGAILNAGFTDAVPTMQMVEEAAVPPAGAGAAALVVYVRSIGLMPGDIVDLTLTGPGGLTVHSAKPPLANWRAQDLFAIGKKRPAGGWPTGVYAADYKVLRQGKAALSRHLELRL